VTASAPAKRPGSEGLKVFAQYDRDFEDEADVVVVGSGPCGSVVAHSLAVAGRSVILLEEGPPFTPQDYEFEGSLSMARTMREGGLRRTEGTILPTMQAIALGGGSLVNSAICVRPPEFVFEGWSSRFDLEHTSREALATRWATRANPFRATCGVVVVRESALPVAGPAPSRAWTSPTSRRHFSSVPGCLRLCRSRAC